MGYTNQRVAYGNTLVELGRQDERIVVLDADLGASTMGKLFEAEFPQRHFEMGIAEANMTSVAAGLAQTGKIPFTNSFAVFAGGRAYDQIRQTTSSIPADNGKAIIYSPNENADGYNKQEMDFEDVSPGMIIGQMVGDGTLPDSVVVMNFEEVDNEGQPALLLDLSSGFGEYVQSMGTAGEDMTMGSLVNTFLDTYGVSSIEILVEGEAFSTGHTEYSGFLSRYE